MIMRHLVHILGLVLGFLPAASCSDDCGCSAAAPGRITVTVGDRNYDNVAQIAGQPRIDERLPFAAYVTDLVLWRHAEGAAGSRTFRPASLPGAAEVEIDARYLLTGTNYLAVVGNEPLLPAGASDTPLFSRELHPGANEYVDLYIGSAEITAPVRGEHVIRLLRAKGKLLVLPERLPDDVVAVEVTVADLFGRVGRDGTYADSAGVVKRFALPATADREPLSLIAAPGRAAGNEASVSLRLTMRDGSAVTLSEIRTPIRRNRISVIKPLYDPDAGSWALELLVDGRWERIEHLRIE